MPGATPIPGSKTRSLPANKTPSAEPKTPRRKPVFDIKSFVVIPAQVQPHFGAGAARTVPVGTAAPTVSGRSAVPPKPAPTAPNKVTTRKPAASVSRSPPKRESGCKSDHGEVQSRGRRRPRHIEQGVSVHGLYLRRRADWAKPFASALFSRGTCEMENFRERANFWQVQCRE